MSIIRVRINSPPLKSSQVTSKMAVRAVCSRYFPFLMYKSVSEYRNILITPGYSLW